MKKAIEDKLALKKNAKEHSLKIFLKMETLEANGIIVTKQFFSCFSFWIFRLTVCISESSHPQSFNYFQTS
jgi:hypothetical protein